MSKTKLCDCCQADNANEGSKYCTMCEDNKRKDEEEICDECGLVHTEENDKLSIKE